MIDIRDMSLTYAGPSGPVHALKNINLDIQAGEIFGIIGRSGAGKSSLVRCINLLNRPTAGQVWVHGRNLLALGEAQLREARREIGMVFQHFNLLSSRTVFDNVALPLELAGVAPAQIRARVMPLLELVGLAHLADRYPAQISGGQKQRVGIARALASKPTVLLSDEATSALDPETTRSILELLRQVNRELGVTVVLITHQMQAIKHIADRVAVMDAGAVVELGSVLQVFTQPQQPITYSLIDEIVPQELPQGVLQRVQALSQKLPAGASGQLLRLSYAGASAYEPVLSHLIRELGLDLSILHGQIDEIQGETFGSLAVFAEGPARLLWRWPICRPRACRCACSRKGHSMFENFSEMMVQLLLEALWETIIMVGISGLLGAVFGVPLGVFLRLTDRGGILPNPPLNAIVGGLVNAARSTPFIILLVAIIPFTRWVTGSSIGTWAAVVPLTVAVAPFMARLVETALREVDAGLIEAAQAMGASTSQIVLKVLLPEAMPGIVAALTISLVSLTGYSAMAGAVGGGGLGDLGIRYGYQRFLPDVMLVVVLVLIVFVQIIQSLGDWLVRRISHR